MILIDTTPLVALCDPRDELHERALGDLDRVRRRPLVLCTPVLTEACFLLVHPVQRARLRRLIDEIPIASLNVDEKEVWSEVFVWLDRYKDHDPDWTDGYLAAVSGHGQNSRVWTYDSEFATVWRRPDGTRIPLFAKAHRETKDVSNEPSGATGARSSRGRCVF